MVFLHEIGGKTVENHFIKATWRYLNIWLEKLHIKFDADHILICRYTLTLMISDVTKTISIVY